MADQPRKNSPAPPPDQKSGEEEGSPARDFWHRRKQKRGRTGKAGKAGPDNLARRNRALAMRAGIGVTVMFGLAFASVPAYRLFCQVTGYAGTPDIQASPMSGQPGGSGALPVMHIRFNANIARDLPWQFQPEETEIIIPIGEDHLATYTARNMGEEPLTGTATFNVTPMKAAQYFSKVECFCFTEQSLSPGESARLPVLFHIDPAFLEDPQVQEVKTLTLSYTFFPKHKQTANLMQSN